MMRTAHLSKLATFALTAVSLLWLPGVALSQTATWFREPSLNVSFAYGAQWHPAQASESATAHVINWLGKGGGLVATCYLQTYAGTQLGQLPASQWQKHADEITATFMKNMSVRYPRTELISSEATVVDGQPVIFVVRDGWMVNLGKEVGIRAWSVATSWKEREVSLECGSSVPHQFPGHEVVGTVEAEVMKVLRTLHFERLP